MSVLRLYFLGTLDIRYDDQPLPKPATLKSQSLLAYLVLHGDKPQPRARLAGLFWGDRPEPKARASLSTALWHIRHVLPNEDLILSDQGPYLSAPVCVGQLTNSGIYDQHKALVDYQLSPRVRR